MLINIDFTHIYMCTPWYFKEYGMVVQTKIRNFEMIERLESLTHPARGSYLGLYKLLILLQFTSLFLEV